MTGTYLMTDAEVVQLTNNIVAGATGKAELAASPVTAAQLNTLAGNSTTAINAEGAANDVATMKRTARIEAMVALREGVNKFAQFADAVYGGNAMDLQAVGLGVRTSSPVGLLPAPANLRSKPGEMDGSVELVWKPLKRGKPQYIAECASLPNGPWTSVYTGPRASTTCTGLTSGAEYYFRVRSSGSAGLGPWSDITRRRAS